MSPPRADIASAVQEAASDLVAKVRPGSRCLVYSVAGAMTAQAALGTRHVIQVGGYWFRNGWDRLGREVTAVLGPAYPDHAPRYELDLHAWFTSLPDGADPEETWSSPPWLEVADLWLRHLAPAWEAKGRPLARPIPPYVWGRRDRVRETTGISFRPDRDATVRFLRLVTEGPESDWWRFHLRTADEVAVLAARKLGLPPLAFTADAVVPQSFMSRWPAAPADDART